MGLDINTPRGQATLEAEMRAAAIYEASHRALYVHTPKKRPAAVDAILLKGKDRLVIGVVETKCRFPPTMTLAMLQGEYRMKWMVTAAKIEKLIMVAQAFQVDAFGMLYITHDDVLLVKQIYSPDHGVTSYVSRISGSQATVNGGSAVRLNAYIDMRDAELIKGKDYPRT
jgi:hypothetical protein